jgi:chemotaxis methyl-accepting protein methylase
MGRKRLWDFLVRATDTDTDILTRCSQTVMSQTAMPDTVTTLLIRGHILI